MSFLHHHKKTEVVISQPGAPSVPAHSGHAGQELEHKKNEHRGEMGALVAGAIAKHEAHKVKTDPAHASEHRTKEKIAGAIAVGSTGYALNEHHHAHEAHKKAEKAKHDEAHKGHHHFFK